MRAVRAWCRRRCATACRTHPRVWFRASSCLELPCETVARAGVHEAGDACDMRAAHRAPPHHEARLAALDAELLRLGRTGQAGFDGIARLRERRLAQQVQR